MKLVAFEKNKDINIANNENYEITSNGCDILRIISNKKEKVRLKLIGNFKKIVFISCNVILDTQDFSCERIIGEDSKIVIIQKNGTHLKSLDLNASNVIFNLPYELEKTSVDVLDILLQSSNITLNNCDFKVENLKLADWSRIFIDPFLKEVNVLIKKIYEDDTSYLVLPENRQLLNLSGVSL